MNRLQYYSVHIRK